MPRGTRTKSVSSTQARQYLGKAEEFLAVAQECLDADRFIAATGNAVHAAINAADAVGARTGSRSAGQDHGEVLALLRQAGREGAELAKQLARLLPLKVRAEYEPNDIPKSAATRAVAAAGKAVGIARAVLPDTHQ